MPSEYIEKTLGEVAFVSSGKRPLSMSKERSFDAPVPVVGGGGPSGFTAQPLTTEHVLITGRVGTLGKLHVSCGPVWPSDNALVIRPRQEVVSFDYLRYALRNVIHFAIGMNRGAANPLVTQTDLSKLTIPVPAPRVQAEVAATLRSLDDRIDLLRQTNATLESIAQALFKSWFIDFDPVRAKAEGREPEGMDAATAALFPAEFEDSALGLIPKGWGVQRLSDMLELAYGKALKATDRRDGQVPVYGSGGITGFHDEALVQSGSIIVGRKGTVGSLYWEDKPFFPIDTTFYVKPKSAPLTFCFYALQCLGLESMNTDAAVPGLNRENAYRLELIRPAPEALRAFDDLGSSLRATMRCNDERAALLACLRDTLLPRLISGKLRLPEAQAQLDDALA